MRRVIALLFLLAVPVSAETLQQDCRAPGSIGTALMSADGTVTLTFNGPIMKGVLAYRRGNPQYARIISHLGGIQPGQKKPVPPWC